MKTRGKKALALLLSLLMLISLFGGLTIVSADGETSAYFAQVDGLTADQAVMIVAKSGDSYYALSYDGAVGAVEVTVDGCFAKALTADADTLLWVYGTNTQMHSAATPSIFLYPYSGGMTYSSGRNMVYSNGVLSFATSSATGYVTFNGSAFNYSTNAADAAEILLFAPSDVGVQADSLTAGEAYFIVAKDGNSYYTLSYDGSAVVAEEAVVSPSEGLVYQVSGDQALWVYGTNTQMHNAATESIFLYPYSGGMTYSSGRNMVYSNGVLSFATSSATGYVTFNGSAFNYSTNAADAAEILLFAFVSSDSGDSGDTGDTGDSGDGELAYFVPAEGLIEGEEYVIVTENQGVSYAMSYDGTTFGAQEITPDSDGVFATAPDSALVWAALADGSQFRLQSAGDKNTSHSNAYYFYGSSNGMVYSSARNVSFADGQLYWSSSSGTSYLSFTGSTFASTKVAGEAATVQLLKRLYFKPSDTAVEMPSIFVVENQGVYYAMSYDGSTFGATEVTVDSNGIGTVAPDGAVVWNPTFGGTTMTLKSAAADAYFYGSSNGMVYSSGRNVTYGDNRLYWSSSSGTSYLSFTGTTFASTKVADEAATVLLYAVPSDLVLYTITFDPNADGFSILKGTKTEGEPYEITETLYRAGYAFEGWNTASDGTGASYAVGEKLSEDSDLTLYAVWSVVEPATFTLTDELTVHNEYVVAAEYEGKYYALTYDGKVGVTEVTVENDTVTNNLLDQRWILSDSLELESVAKTGTFLYPYSSGMTYSSGRNMEYDDGILHFPTSSAIGYVTFNGSSFGYSNTESDAATIALFTREVEYVEPPQAEPAPIPAPDTITRTAVTNADGTVTLGFTSDVHHPGGSTLNLQTWLEASGVGYIDGFGFCGDMGSAYLSGDAFWNATQEVMDYMDALEEAGQVGNSVYTHGNHEWFPSAGGDYGKVYETNTTAQRLMQIGEGLVTDKYIIYCFGAGEISASQKYDYNVYDAEKLAAYLETAPTDRPIFILTHFPLHIWKGNREMRYMKHGDPVIDALNAGVDSGHQIIVLWGHNHSDYDDNYYAPVYPGEEITVNPSGDKRMLKFTYLAAGCTADAEYTGPSAGSAACMNKGLIVTINPDRTLEFEYYTIDGQKMNVESPWMVRFRAAVDNYDGFATQYVNDGEKAKTLKAPRFKGYEFDSWVTREQGKEIPFSFDDPITRNMLVTAIYTDIPVEELTITPDATYNEESLTMTVDGVQPRYTNFDISTITGGDGGPYTYAIWFEEDGVFSFNRDVTLTHQYFDTASDGSYTLAGVDEVTVHAGEVIKVADGVYSQVNQTQVVWSEFGLALDDGNTLMIIDASDPGNYSSSEPNTHLSKFPGTVTGLPLYYYEYTFETGVEGDEPEVLEKLEGDIFDFANAPVPEREGYDFLGWNSEPDGSGEMYEGDEILDTDADLTFYAVWEEKPLEFEEEEEEEPASEEIIDETEPEEELEPAVVAVETAVEDGVATAAAEDEAVVEAAQDEKKGDVVLQVEASEEADTTAIELSADAVKAVADADKALVFSVGGDENTPATTVELDAKTLSALAEQGETVSVQFQKNEDGSLTLDVKVGEESAELEGGLKVSLPAETAPGQVLVVVAEDGTETVVRKSAAEDGEMTALLEGGATIKIVDNAKDFDDVDEDAWYADAVDFVSSHELFVGDENGNFNPNDTMTRAMMAMVMFRLEGEPEAGEGKSFADVEEGKWYSEAINWASAEGVMNGYGESFGVNDPVTREQMAVLLYNYVQSLGIEVKAGSTEKYIDAGEVHSWAADAMAWAVGEGIFQGDGQGYLNPTGAATRADVATLMERVVKLLLK